MSEFDALDEMDKAYLMAYWRTIDSMTAWEQKLQQDELQSKTKAK